MNLSNYLILEAVRLWTNTQALRTICLETGEEVFFNVAISNTMDKLAKCNLTSTKQG